MRLETRFWRPAEINTWGLWVLEWKVVVEKLRKDTSVGTSGMSEENVVMVERGRDLLPPPSGKKVVEAKASRGMRLLRGMAERFTWSLFSARTFAGADKAGNRYFSRKEEIDGILKEKRWVIFKGEDDPTSIPVEWICWLNGQRKIAPTPELISQAELAGLFPLPLPWLLLTFAGLGEAKSTTSFTEMAEMEARRQRVKLNVALLKKEEEERKAKGGSIKKAASTSKVGGPELRSFIQQFPGTSQGDKTKETDATGGMRDSGKICSAEERISDSLVGKNFLGAVRGRTDVWVNMKSDIVASSNENRSSKDEETDKMVQDQAKQQPE
ncbi:hypothetical protein RJ639_041025 [Escallonia herrerae]|uniref:NADH dehydrogenase [ubiquinone] 1 alpha subcomplex subunit 12 n=1 Tax=Escallonia herrerae TaxID=1293975 RepID=A0AA89B5I3_9ASTE|nr:hypothetical protein RJ639_041025 [Escallonia herrerae]